MQQENHSTLRCNQLVPGKYQPRTYFDPKSMEELTQSIKVQGVLQPLLIRPLDDELYEIVAGERRWRAAMAAHGADFAVPVLVRQMTDNEAREAALTENIQRDDMSPTEEAVAAAQVLGECNNDRAEAAKRLGWSVGTLDSRLALMNCSDNVKKALNERRISLGQAELLAAITKANQDVVLERMFAAPKMPTVPETKAMLNSLARKLESAIFNKTDCAGCQHNSSNQKALFSEAIDSGNCTNGSCYEQKTEDELETRASTIRENYPVVRIVRAGENFTLIKLKAIGATGVGEEQFKACHGCANFGAAISAVPDKLGEEYRDLCFDAACNATKVAEQLKATKEADQAAKAANKSAATTSKDAASSSSGTATAGKVQPPATTPKVQESTRLKEYRVKVWRSLLNKLLISDPERNLITLIALAMTNNAGKIDGSAITKAFETKTQKRLSSSTDIGAVAADLASSSKDVLDLMRIGLAATAARNIEEQTLTRLLTWMNADLAAHWKLEEEYLGLLTKSEIEVVADEIGLKAHLGKEFAKVMAGKKDELLKALLNADGFDYTRKVPKHLYWK